MRVKTQFTQRHPHIYISVHNARYQCHKAANCTWTPPANNYVLAAQNLVLAMPKSITLDEKCLSFLGEKSQKNGPLAEKGQDRKSKRTRQKKQRGDRKGESNDSPEIPDRGEFQTSLQGFQSRVWHSITDLTPTYSPTHTHSHSLNLTHTHSHNTHTHITHTLTYTHTHTHTHTQQ